MQAARLLSQVRTIAAFAYRKSRGLPIIYPKPDLQVHGELPAHDVLAAVPGLRAEAGGGQGAGPDFPAARRSRAELLDGDGAHGGVEPGQPVRQRGGGGLRACGARCTAAPTRPCSRCWRRSTSRATTARKFIAAAKDKNSGKRLMGFGHRVYKNYDPRAKIIKKACDEVLAKLHISDPLAGHCQAPRGGGAAAIPISSSASSIPTSTSTAASSCAPSAFRWRCSR